MRGREVKKYSKKKLPLDKTRSLLEPGPIVLVSSQWKNERTIMTMGWHAMMGYEAIGCYIWDANFSHNLIKKSKQCVINLPEKHLLETAIAIGNTTGADIDKFAEFGLTAEKGEKVQAPLIKECYANFECEVIDTRLVNQFNFFVLQVVAAQSAISPKYPKTFHYRGNGVFMTSGENIDRSKFFSPEMLDG